jgi:hypothetical protein
MGGRHPLLLQIGLPFVALAGPAPARSSSSSRCGRVSTGQALSSGCRCVHCPAGGVGSEQDAHFAGEEALGIGAGYGGYDDSEFKKATNWRENVGERRRLVQFGYMISVCCQVKLDQSW